MKAKVKEARAHPCIYPVAGCSSLSSVLVTPAVTPAGFVVSGAISVISFWRLSDDQVLWKMNVMNQ